MMDDISTYLEEYDNSNAEKYHINVIERQGDERIQAESEEYDFKIEKNDESDNHIGFLLTVKFPLFGTQILMIRLNQETGVLIGVEITPGP